MAIPAKTPLHRFVERFYPLGYPVSVETGDREIAVLVSTLWGDWPQLVPGDPLRVSIEVAQSKKKTASFGRGSVLRFRATPNGFRLDGPGSAIFDVSSLHLQIQMQELGCEHFLNTAILTALDFSLFTPLHAACVLHNGSGVLLCGDSGAGKSTLSYACARLGWTLVSDDSLHLLPGLGTTVASFSSTIHLREPARALFSELRQQHLGLAPNGKPAMEIRSIQQGFHTARTACVERAVFLSRRPGPPQLTALDLNVAEQYFLKYLWQPNLQTHQQRLHEIVTHTGAALFEYDRVDEAVDALEGLLRDTGLAA